MTNRVVITEEMLTECQPDLRAVAEARIRGERPDCSCQPIHAWPGGGPVIGYHDLCPEHRGEATR